MCQTKMLRFFELAKKTTEIKFSDFLPVANTKKRIVNRKTTFDDKKANWPNIRSIRIEISEPFLLII